MPLRLKNLLVQEVTLLLKVIRLGLPLLNLLCQVLSVSFHLDLVVSVRSNGLLKHVDLVVFKSVVAVLKVQLVDHLTKVFLLPLHVDVVGLEVFKLLLSQDIV